MRFLATLLTCAALCAAIPAVAADKQKCPLEVGACLDAFAKMKTRPWLGITYRHDSTGTFTVVEVMPGSPAERGGLQSGDVLLQLNGAAITEQARLIAGKAGWRTGDDATYRIRRQDREQDVRVQLATISDEQLARLIGVHMVEGHLAWADTPSHVH